MASIYGILIQLAVVLLLYRNSNAGGAVAQALKGCSDRCGNLTIPYPFGRTEDCYFDPDFLITCNVSTGKAYLWDSNIEVTNISIHDGGMQILKYVAIDCYTRSGDYDENSSVIPEFILSSFTISARNKFIAIGCDTIAEINGYRAEKPYRIGCTTSCNEVSDIYTTDSCSGVGCCETAIPRGLTNISVYVNSYYNHSYVWDFNPCSYAFLAEESQFKFSKTSFEDFKNKEYFVMDLDWTIGNLSCEEAKKESGKMICKGNSTCVNSNTASGYLCQCLRGYEGNPYHPDGCQDIDECEARNPCIGGTCNNTPGSFNCTCQDGYTLDINGTINTCRKLFTVSNSTIGSQRALFLYIPLSLSVGFIALVLATSMMFWGMKKRKLIKLREKFFEQNGGIMLQQRMSSHRGSLDTTKIFTMEELKKATNNFHESRILGEGGYGTVYKGVLADHKLVAIKKSKVGAQTQTEQFINEVIVLMQINHKNIVKLLGCCFETEVPLLVYEFITNGTLFERIHYISQEATPLSWELRLKIASETAEALAYLHYHTSIQIIHRDVKTANILLDDNHTAKVSDFGASRLNPLDEDQLQTFVQGTLGYLDPEYMHSSQLTEKSDVYSFGVVLAELLTSRKALAFHRPETDRNLANCFVSAIKEDRLLDILDVHIVNDENFKAPKEVANLAGRCLRVRGEERPSMKEVAMELEGLRIAEKHPWKEADLCPEETEYLLGSPLDPYCIDIMAGESSNGTSTDYFSLQNKTLTSYGDGR